MITASKVRGRKRFFKIVRRSLLILLVFLTILYIILDVIYNEGRFTVMLDSNKTLESGLAIYDSLNNNHGKRKLEATPIKFIQKMLIKKLMVHIMVKTILHIVSMLKIREKMCLIIIMKL